MTLDSRCNTFTAPQSPLSLVLQNHHLSPGKQSNVNRVSAHELYLWLRKHLEDWPRESALRGVTLTTRPNEFSSCLERFLAHLSNEKLSALLCLDIGKNLEHLHIHGFVFGHHNTWPLKRAWRAAGGGRNEVRTFNPDREGFQAHLKTWCDYSLKPIAGEDRLGPRERVITLGVFDEVWACVPGSRPPQQQQQAEPVLGDSSAKRGKCVACGKELPTGSRAHRKTHSVACRVAKYRRSKKRRLPMLVDDRPFRELAGDSSSASRPEGDEQ